MPKKAVAASLNPETYVDAGGMFDDANITITNVKFEMYDYEGKSPVDAPVLAIDMVEDGKTYDKKSPVSRQRWSMGDAKRWKPSPDGKTLISIMDPPKPISNSCRGAFFMKSLVDAGYDPEKLNGGDITILEGLRVNTVRIPAPEYNIKGKDKKEKEYVDEIIVVGALLDDAPAATGTTAAPVEADAGGGESPVDIAVATLTEILSDEKQAGSVAKKDLPGLALKALGSNPQKAAVLQLLFQDSFFNDAGNPFALNDGTVTFG